MSTESNVSTVLDVKTVRENAPHLSADWDGERCRDCKRGYQLVWTAPNDLWNRIWGNEGGLLCPDCFDVRCRAKGTYLRFRVELL